MDMVDLLLLVLVQCSSTVPCFGSYSPWFHAIGVVNKPVLK